MRSNLSSGTLTIYLEGRIDSNNAEKIGAEIEECRAQNPSGRVIVDCEQLAYVSSAGLRQFLKLRKSTASLTFTNVQSDVYDILDMTGFTEMMDVQKAFRPMSVEGCEIIGEGSNGIVYRIDEETIIKVYRNSDAIDDIKKERELARKALILGLNTAISFDIVKVGDSYGSVFELVSSKSLSKLIASEPEKTDFYVGILADTLKEIHQTDAPDANLPSAREIALRWARWLEGRIDAGHYEKLIAMIKTVPEDTHLIHGDYHTSNVHYANGEAILIDMDTLSVGNPIFEWGSIFMGFVGFGQTDRQAPLKSIKMTFEEATRIFDRLFDIYFADRISNPDFKDGTLAKIRVLAYTRLLRRTMRRDPDNVGAIRFYKDSLIENLDKIETLMI